MTRKPAKSSVPIDALLARRFTTHAFAAEEPVPAAVRLALLEAARWAPSHENLEPWRFVVCDRFGQPDAWQKAFDALSRSERPWAYNASLMILCAADLENVAPALQPRALFDTGGAALQLCLEATARDLATHITSGFDESRLRAGFGIPEQAALVALVCVGTPADLGTLGRDVQRRELTPRARSPLGSRCFEARWGRALR